MAETLSSNENIWSCKIGGKIAALSTGADWPMRAAVERAFRELTGVDAEFTFSGWAAELTEGERAVVEHRAPKLCEIDRPHQYECKRCGIAPPTGASEPPKALPAHITLEIKDAVNELDCAKDCHTAGAMRIHVVAALLGLGKLLHSETKEGG